MIVSSHTAVRSHFRLLLVTVVTVLALAGCASGGKAIDKLLGRDKEAEPAPPPTVPVHLIAASNLNSGTDGRASAVVLKVYHLRNTKRFEQAPLSAFLDPAGEQSALGSDLLASNEIVLTPGARQDLSEKMSDGAVALGVVALFRAPADNRWRLVFDTTGNIDGEGEKKKKKDAIPSDITVGIHACALSSGSPGLLTQLPTGAASLVSVRCIPGG